jgi:hexosaminidase
MNDRLTGLVPRPAAVRPQPGTLALTAAPAIAGRDPSLAAAITQALAPIPWPAQLSSQSEQAKLTIEPAPDLAPEAYRLAITPAGITVEVSGPPGAFYAAQTIRQLLPADAWRTAPLQGSEKDWRIPCATIEDAPAPTSPATSPPSANCSP